MELEQLIKDARQEIDKWEKVLLGLEAAQNAFGLGQGQAVATTSTSAVYPIPAAIAPTPLIRPFFPKATSIPAPNRHSVKRTCPDGRRVGQEANMLRVLYTGSATAEELAKYLQWELKRVRCRLTDMTYRDYITCTVAPNGTRVYTLTVAGMARAKYAVEHPKAMMIMKASYDKWLKGQVPDGPSKV